MTPRVLLTRAFRKATHLTRRLLQAVAALVLRMAGVMMRLENKASERLTGIPEGYAGMDEISVDEIVFNSIPFNLAPLNPALPALGRKGAVTLLIPSLQQTSFYGGTATALTVAGFLAAHLGKPLRIFETLAPGGKKGLSAFYAGVGLPELTERNIELVDVSSRRPTVYGYIDMHPDDEFVASAWWDAVLLDRLPRERRYVYLIQDYEPIFYPNGDRSAMAQNSYRSEDFVPFCNTRIMYEFMSARFPRIERDGLWFEPAIAVLDTGGPALSKEKRRLFFYARPAVDRNLFSMGLLALDKACATGVLDAGWEIVAAGQEGFPDVTLSNGMRVENLGKLSPEEYRRFVPSVDLALSLMLAPHPNYPTLELASAGAAVVTTRYENKTDLSRYSQNIVMADPTVDSIVSGLGRGAAMSVEDRQRNVSASTLPTSWDSALKEPIARLAAALAAGRSRPPDERPD